MRDVSRPNPTRGRIGYALALAGIQVGGALALTFANKLGVIEEETATRGVMMLIGLCLAAIGNRMPKRPDGPPPASLVHSALQQSVMRVAGWAMMLGGLAFAGFWAFAPRDVAEIGSIASVATGVAVMASYCGWRASRRAD